MLRGRRARSGSSSRGLARRKKEWRGNTANAPGGVLPSVGVGVLAAAVIVSDVDMDEMAKPTLLRTRGVMKLAIDSTAVNTSFAFVGITSVLQGNIVVDPELDIEYPWLWRAAFCLHSNGFATEAGEFWAQFVIDSRAKRKTIEGDVFMVAVKNSLNSTTTVQYWYDIRCLLTIGG